MLLLTEVGHIQHNHVRAENFDMRNEFVIVLDLEDVNDSDKLWRSLRRMFCIEDDCERKGNIPMNHHNLLQ